MATTILIKTHLILGGLSWKLQVMFFKSLSGHTCSSVNRTKTIWLKNCFYHNCQARQLFRQRNLWWVVFTEPSLAFKVQPTYLKYTRTHNPPEVQNPHYTWWNNINIRGKKFRFYFPSPSLQRKDCEPCHPHPRPNPLLGPYKPCVAGTESTGHA